MKTQLEYWEKRCELAERVISDLNKGPIETIDASIVFKAHYYEWKNFKQNAVICDDVNEESSNKQRRQANEWLEKIDLNKLEECNGDVE